MEAVSGIWGYVVFWGLTALAAGIFLQRFWQLTKTGYTGRRQRRTGPDNEENCLWPSAALYSPVVPV